MRMLSNDLLQRTGSHRGCTVRAVALLRGPVRNGYRRGCGADHGPDGRRLRLRVYEIDA